MGEIQLKQIIADVLTPQQYDIEVPTKPGSNDHVEIAIKIPEREGSGYFYLPIDSKCHLDCYETLLDAYDSGDKEAIKKAKKVFSTEDANLVIVSYKDDATAFNGEKKGTIVGKGVVNNRVTNRLMKYLEANGLPTHFVEELNDRETLVKRVKIVPLEVIVRNIAAGSLAKRLGLEEGTPLKRTVLEYCYKDDALGDPMVNEYHILAMEYATEEELKLIAGYSLRVNELLGGFFEKLGVRLIDFKLEYGRTSDGSIVLADEISPDT